jgi:chromosome segregation ATPase
MLDDQSQRNPGDDSDFSGEASPSDAIDRLTKPAADRSAATVKVMAVIAAALFVLLLVVNVRSQRTRSFPAAAEIEARQAEVNRKSNEWGRSARDSGLESVDAIALRLKNDSEALVAITRRVQEMLVEQESAEGSTRIELLRLEQSRQALSEEVSQLRRELEAAQRSSADRELLMQQVDALRSERDSLNASLTDLRNKLKTVGEIPDPAEIDDLRRRLAETTSAKEFFETRTTELELEIEALRQELK